MQLLPLPFMSIWAIMFTTQSRASSRSMSIPHSGTVMRRRLHNTHNNCTDMKEYKYTINGNKYEVVIADITDNIATLTVNGEEYTVEMEKQAEPEKPKPVVRPTASESGDSGASASASAGSASGTAIKAPLPGVITEICVSEGQEVQAGDTVIVLEAMKMANALQAEKSGKISAICVKVGQSVMEDEALVYIE